MLWILYPLLWNINYMIELLHKFVLFATTLILILQISIVLVFRIKHKSLKSSMVNLSIFVVFLSVISMCYHFYFYLRDIKTFLPNASRNSFIETLPANYRLFYFELFLIFSSIICLIVIFYERKTKFHGSSNSDL